jgi:hypothetical protein
MFEVLDKIVDDDGLKIVKTKPTLARARRS